MIQQLWDDLISYFQKKADLNEEERRLLNRLTDGDFPITSVHRNDLAHKGFDVRNISNQDMEELARKMSSDYQDQLFWDSMVIIADELDFPRHPHCPYCQSGMAYLNIPQHIYECGSCGQKWHEGTYVLVMFPDDPSFFVERHIGYPSLESCNGMAQYVPVDKYIRHFKTKPDENKCYRPVQWPDSQKYTSEDENGSTTALCEVINDKYGIKDFGPNALWVPLCSIHQ